MNTITTTDELDALPVGSVVLDAFAAICALAAARKAGLL